MGLTDAAASFIVRRHCFVFWGAILVSLGFGVVGVMLMTAPGFGNKTCPRVSRVNPTKG